MAEVRPRFREKWLLSALALYQVLIPIYKWDFLQNFRLVSKSARFHNLFTLSYYILSLSSVVTTHKLVNRINTSSHLEMSATSSPCSFLSKLELRRN